MSYFPDRRSGIDPAGIADALSESNPNSYGTWSAGYGNNATLDAHPAVGNYALSCNGFGTGVIEVADLLFTLNTPLDLTSFEKFQFMIAAVVGANNNLVGVGNIVLKCSVDEWSSAEASFTFAKGAIGEAPAYYNKTFIQSDFIVNTRGGVWDWTKVNRIWLQFPCQNLYPANWDGYQIWIDGGPFFLLSSAPSRLAIYAEDINGIVITGKHGTFVGPSGSTTQENIPFGPAIVNPGTWSITPTDTDFARWKDGSIERTRLVVVPSGGLGSATAVFEAGTPPPDGDGGGSNLLLLAAGGIGILAVITYFYTRG